MAWSSARRLRTAANPPIASSAATGISIDLPTTQVTRSTAAPATAAGDEAVELEVLHDRPGVRLAHPGEQVAHQPHARLGQVAGRLPQVRRPDPDVRVADQDHVVLAVPVHRRQVLDLRD